MDSNPRQFWVTPDITCTRLVLAAVLYGMATSTSSPVRRSPGTGQGTFGPGDTGETGLQILLGRCLPDDDRTKFQRSQQSIASIRFHQQYDTEFGDRWLGISAVEHRSAGPRAFRGRATQWCGTSRTRLLGSRTPSIRRFRKAIGCSRVPAIIPRRGSIRTDSRCGCGRWRLVAAVRRANASYAATFVELPVACEHRRYGSAWGLYRIGTSAWTAATHVTDGGVTWVCLTPVDYNTFTGANVDDIVNWAPGTPYFYHAVRNQ